MLLSTRDRIYCDTCGIIYKNKFTYYSVEYTKVIVDSECSKTGACEISKEELNLDVCQKCYDEIKQKVLAVSKKGIKNERPMI